MRRLYGRVYYNEGAMAHVLSREYGLPAALVGRAWGSDEATHADRQGRFRLRRTIRGLPALLIQLVDRLRAEREIELLFPQIDRWVAQFQQRDLEALSDDQLCDELARTWRRRFIRALGLAYYRDQLGDDGLLRSSSGSSRAGADGRKSRST